LYAGVVGGLIVAIGIGIFSFPREKEISKTITGTQTAGSDAEVQTLIAALQQALENNAGLRRVSEEEFRELDLASTHSYPEAHGDAGFVIRHVGEDASGTVYLAERTVNAGPWWHPDRLAYRAAEAEVDRFSDGLRLTFQRDWEGLAGVLLVDAIVGWVYGMTIGLILAVVGSRELSVPGGAPAIRSPDEASPAMLGKGEL
jgi:hypothetical protein